MNLKLVNQDLRSRAEYKDFPLKSKIDSGSSSYWENRYLKNDTPWDAGKTPNELKDYLASVQKTGRVLIPGCGAAYEARTFAEAGFEVYAIDFSSTAVKLAQKSIGTKLKSVILGDFFSFDFGELSFDIVYERAFLCALPPTLWTQYARRQADLLRVGGQLLGFFVYGNKQSGPPFELKPKELNILLGDQFTLIKENKVQSSISLFTGKECWQIWERTA